VIDIFSFDHDVNRFVNIGPGTVDEEALLIVSDPGFGITKAGWGLGGPPPPPTTCTSSCNDGNRCTADGCAGGVCVSTRLTSLPMPATMCEGCLLGFELDKKTKVECCADIAPASGGGNVACCNGSSKFSCVGNGFPSGTPAQNIIRQCVFEHEDAHFPHGNCPDSCDTSDLKFNAGTTQAMGECQAALLEVVCLQVADCPGTGDAKATCEAAVLVGIASARNYGNGFPGCNLPL
jgi:hypothetical protein